MSFELFLYLGGREDLAMWLTQVVVGPTQPRLSLSLVVQAAPTIGCGDSNTVTL